MVEFRTAALVQSLASLPIQSVIRLIIILGLAACAPGGGNDDTSDGTPPVVSGFARYFDNDSNSISGAGDKIIVPFDQDVNLNVTDASIFTLPVNGDSFGSGASVEAGPANNEITITLGASPGLMTRQDYNGKTTINFPSGIDVSSSLTLNSVEGASGIDAKASTPIDVIPAFVDSQQTIGSGNRFENSLAFALGDVDSDGNLDMAIAYAGDPGANRVYTNDGAGNFTNTGQLLGSFFSTSIALGDVDDDGDLDIVVGNTEYQGNQIYINDGTGNFSNSGQSLGADSTNRIVLGDVDNDGDLDMAVANASGQPNRVYTNNGAGNFTDSDQALGLDDSEYVVLGDVDKDGDLDMAVANTSGQANRIYTNNGTGIFTDSGQLLGSDNSEAVVLGDIDNDGDLDMAVGNSDGNRVYFNDGAGNFTDSNQTFSLGLIRSTVFGDVDSDGDLDMVIANSSGENRVYSNDGTGFFTDTGQSYDLDTGISSEVVLGDVDNDGDLDFAVATFGGLREVDYGVTVFLNSLSGTWGNTKFISSQSFYYDPSSSVALGDVDGDGDPDMLVTGAPGNYIYTNNGSGYFTDSGQSVGTYPYGGSSIASGDVDSDGDLDIVVANVNAANRIYTNNGVGVFSDSGQSLGTSSSRFVVLGDVDNDGDLDMAVANASGQPSLVYINNDAGIFSDSGQSLGSSGSIALGDVDNDGDLDLVASAAGGNRVYNNDAGIFSDSGQSLGSNGGYIALGDVDNDGDLDIAVANNEKASRVYTNNGAGVFTDSGQTLGLVNGYYDASVSVALSDVDGDGNLDMVVANYRISDRIYTNDGTGIFTESNYLINGTPRPLPSGTRSTYITLSDVDRDGDPDIVETNSLGANLVYLNSSGPIVPWVTSRTPSYAQENVAINTTVTATFSWPMDETTINTSTFTLKTGNSGTSGTPVSGTVSYSGLTATFTPSAPLAYNTTYYAEVTRGAQDTAGIPLGGQYEDEGVQWLFTTIE